jgi:hypothetical protein
MLCIDIYYRAEVMDNAIGIVVILAEGFAKAINTNKIKAKNAEKAQFTVVNEHFEAFFNENIGSRMGFAKASSNLSCILLFK